MDEALGLLKQHVEERLAAEGWQEHVLNLLVEFNAANASSLDIVLIIDFKGDVAQFYGRLRRAMQRWCVEACTRYGWEIPFQQVVLHQASADA